MSSNTLEPESALAYVLKSAHIAQTLEVERLHALRSLTETDAAHRFATLLQGSLPLPTRTSSGLVEQQRVFSRLREPNR